MNEELSKIIAEYKKVRKNEEEAYKSYHVAYNAWEKLAFDDNYYDLSESEEYRVLKERVDLAYDSYEKAKEELCFYSRYAMDRLIDLI